MSKRKKKTFRRVKRRRANPGAALRRAKRKLVPALSGPARLAFIVDRRLREGTANDAALLAVNAAVSLYPSRPVLRGWRKWLYAIAERLKARADA